MEKKKKKKQKVLIKPIIDNISTYSDMEYSDSENEYINELKKNSKTHNMPDYYDDYDGYEDECEYDDYLDDNLTAEEDNDCSEQDYEHVNAANVAAVDVDRYMDSALWIHEIAERGFMFPSEKPYIELMIADLAKIVTKEELSENCKTVLTTFSAI